MLKIKDNVDLKELEKFGFDEKTFDVICNRNLIPSKYIKLIKTVGKRKIHNLIISIEQDKTILVFWSYSYYIIYLKRFKKYIKDLIQADLIEKVEEKL